MSEPTPLEQAKAAMDHAQRKYEGIPKDAAGAARNMPLDVVLHLHQIAGFQVQVAQAEAAERTAVALERIAKALERAHPRTELG